MVITSHIIPIHGTYSHSMKFCIKSVIIINFQIRCKYFSQIFLRENLLIKFHIK